MIGLKKFGNPAEQTVHNFMEAANAYADQMIKSGQEKVKFLSAANAKEVYGKMLRAVIAMANPANPKHNEVFNSLKKELGNNQEALNTLEQSGQRIMSSIHTLARTFNEKGYQGEEAITAAFNSLMGNPVFDHFGNINLLAGQLYQDKTFVENFISKGDSFAVPVEAGTGANGTALSRFRIPTERVTGSAKIYQGDINPQDRIQHDANRIQHSLFNEFKDAQTLYANFSITQDQRNQALGFQQAVSPALAGFVLQNRYFSSSQEQVMKLAEALFVDGQSAAGTYTPNVGGSYGILSSAIMLALADAGADQPTPATTADWVGNPTKLIQKITNFYAKPASITAPLPADLGTTGMYKDIVRLFSLPALQNVEFTASNWTLYVPASWYALSVQYPSTGTFNRQLQEMVKKAVGDRIVKSIDVMPSSLLDYRAENFHGLEQNNFMIAVAHGAETEKKPIIMPGQTAVPVVVSENVSSQIMNFSTQYAFGGPLVSQYGGVFAMEFSVAALPD